VSEGRVLSGVFKGATLQDRVLTVPTLHFTAAV